MKRRLLGSTGLEVGEIGFGAWAVGSHQWGEVNDAESLAAVRAARECGATFFDTAQEYGTGHSERMVGRALKGDDDAFVATKVGKWWFGDTPETFRVEFSAAFIHGMADGSLARLGRDTIDLYQLHNPGAEVCERDETWQALENLKKAGKIRFFGASIESDQELALCLDRKCAALQFEFSLLRPHHRDWIGRCAEAGAAVIIRTPLAYGSLSGKYKPGDELPENDFRHPNRWGGRTFRRFVEQARDLAFLDRHGQTMPQAALRYVLAEPNVSVVIPGAKTPGQVRDNCAAGQGALSEEDLARIAGLQQVWLAEEK